MKKIIITIIIVAIIIFMILGKLFGPPAPWEEDKEQKENLVDESKERKVDDYWNVLQSLPSCEDKTELFTVSPVKIEDMTHITPLGSVSPPSHVFPIDHMYWRIRKVTPRDWESGSVNVPVYAPGDMWITRMWSIVYGHTYSEDYSVFFSPCKEVEGFFFHMISISDKLKKELENSDNCQEYSTGGNTHQMCEKEVMVKVKAGEQIGTVGGFNREHLDVGMVDLRKPELKHANLDRWEGRANHLVCPLDYFSSEIKKGLEAKLGEPRGNDFIQKTNEPLCGIFNQDLPGTAQGVWFLEGTKETYPEDKHLALVHDDFDHDKPVFSIGTSLGIESERYYYNSVSTGFVNRDFSDITPGNIYCFETKHRFKEEVEVFILEMTSEAELKIEYTDLSGCGTGPWEFENPVEFER